MEIYVPFVLSNEKTTGKRNQVFLSFFSVSSNKLTFVSFRSNKQRCSQLKQFGNIPLVSGGRMICLFRQETSQGFSFCCHPQQQLSMVVGIILSLFSHLRRGCVSVGATWLLNTLVFAQSFSQLYTIQMLAIHLLSEDTVCILKAENS